MFTLKYFKRIEIASEKYFGAYSWMIKLLVLVTSIRIVKFAIHLSAAVDILPVNGTQSSAKGEYITYA